jgi:prevent-host-death family protein
MNTVGIRELRDHLSQHLAEVREGHTVTITDHGTSSPY